MKCISITVLHIIGHVTLSNVIHFILFFFVTCLCKYTVFLSTCPRYTKFWLLPHPPYLGFMLCIYVCLSRWIGLIPHFDNRLFSLTMTSFFKYISSVGRGAANANVWISQCPHYIPISTYSLMLYQWVQQNAL